MSAVNVLTFCAFGRVAGQGSKHKGAGGRFYEASKYLPEWRKTMATAIRAALAKEPGWDPEAACYEVNAIFLVKRPRSHYRTGKHSGDLKAGAPTWAPGTPDLDKRTRALCDALQAAGAVKDDRRIVRIVVSSVYAGDQSGVLAEVYPLGVRRGRS